MKRISVATVALAMAMIGLSRCDDSKKETEKTSDTTMASSNTFGGYESQVKYGEHLVTIMSCTDCHTPKKMTDHGPVDDSTLFLSGHPANMPPPDVNRQEIESKGLAVTQTLTGWVGPWGISYAANLTSDTTGIGMWTEDQFILALRKGKWKGMEGNRSLMPPMPWQTIGQATDDELKAIFAFLKSTKPVKNVHPSIQPPITARP